MRRGYTREREFFLGSAFGESIPRFGGVVLSIKRQALDSPKKRPTVGRRKNLLWVVDATYGRSSRRPTVDPFLPLPKRVNETACMRGSKPWDALRETGKCVGALLRRLSAFASPAEMQGNDRRDSAMMLPRLRGGCSAPSDYLKMCIFAPENHSILSIIGHSNEEISYSFLSTPLRGSCKRSDGSCPSGGSS